MRKKTVYVGISEVRPQEIDVGQTVSEMVTMSDGLTIQNTPEARAAYHESQKAALAAAQEANRRQLSLNTGRSCPIQYDENNGRARECKRDCTFFDADSDSCRFSGGDPIETLDERCPFMKKCVSSCAWYHGGCTLCYLVSKVT